MQTVLFIELGDGGQEPLGSMYVAAALGAHGVRVMVTTAAEVTKTLYAMKGNPPDYLMFSVTTGKHRKAEKLYEELYHSYAISGIFGGPHFLYADDINLPNDIPRVIFRGECDNITPQDLIGGGVVSLPVPMDLDEVPLPRREPFYNAIPAMGKNRIRNIITARGCAFNCHYCGAHLAKAVQGTNKIRHRTPSSVVAEAQKISAPSTIISFVDDVFGSDMDWLERFAKQWIKIGKPPFFCQLRPELVTADRLKLLKQAGVLNISIGVETGTEEIRKQVLGRTATNEKIRSAAKMLHEYSIPFRTYNMIGIPCTQDPTEEAWKTLLLNVELDPDLAWCSILSVYPGTKLAAKVLEHYSLLDEDDLYSQAGEDFFTHCPTWVPEHKKIERLQRLWTLASKGNDLTRWLVKNVLLNLPIEAWPWLENKLGKELKDKYSRSKLWGIDKYTE